MASKNPTSKFAAPFALAASVLASAPAPAAVDIFLKLEGIPGESIDATHGKEVDVLAWSWNLSNRVEFTGSTQAQSRLPRVFDVAITKYVDSTSTDLSFKLLTGKSIPTADLSVRKAGLKPLDYLKLNMKDVYVTSVATGGSAGGDSLTENVTLNFGSICVTYTAQNPDGSPGASEETCWDNVTAKATN